MTSSSNPASANSPAASQTAAQGVIVDFADLDGQACPCGTTRRAFAEIASVPLTLHQVEISLDARCHYHRGLTEIYYFLECEPNARLELDGELLPVHAGMSVLIPPGVRHRAVGKMRVLNIVSPKFDPADEWFD